MRILIVIGAGASMDCWPGAVINEQDRLPLANKLFTPLNKQNLFLNKYDLMGLASKLRRQAREEADKFDIEKELAAIADRAEKDNDPNTKQSLFKTRFYLNSLINELTKITLNNTSSHTTYVDLIYQLKEWIDDDPRTRFVDIVTFNYDNLIEKAMENVYSYDWGIKNQTPMSAYYGGTNLRIYKPHGSINWYRTAKGADTDFHYHTAKEAFRWFNQIYIGDQFGFVDPDVFNDLNVNKSYIPAIAVPLRNKTDFQECPEEMFQAMIKAINASDKLITFGWKGSDNHFVDLLKEQKDRIKEIHIVSPSADTNLGTVYEEEYINTQKFGFRDFVSDSSRLSDLLDTFKSS